jgi:hypothetical protein
MANSYPAFDDAMSHFAAIVLEVSELLEQRSKEVTMLSFKEQEVLKEGLHYLELARTGQETVQVSGASIVSRDERLSVYEETSRALLWAHSPAADPTGKKALFNTSMEVLLALLSGKALNELDPDAIKQTRTFFRTMEDYYFSGQPSHTESLFDRPFDFEG